MTKVKKPALFKPALCGYTLRVTSHKHLIHLSRITPTQQINVVFKYIKPSRESMASIYSHSYMFIYALAAACMHACMSATNSRKMIACMQAYSVLRAI
jgi:hypothetical protein